LFDCLFVSLFACVLVCLFVWHGVWQAFGCADNKQVLCFGLYSFLKSLPSQLAHVTGCTPCTQVGRSCM
jgi:hypothetical protein